MQRCHLHVVVGVLSVTRASELNKGVTADGFEGVERADRLRVSRDWGRRVHRIETNSRQRSISSWHGSMPDVRCATCGRGVLSETRLFRGSLAGFIFHRIVRGKGNGGSNWTAKKMQ